MRTIGDLQSHLNKEVAKDIDNLYSHAEIANKEMGQIKTDIAIMKSDYKLLKDQVEAVDNKQWAIIALIIGAALGVIFIK